MSSRHDIIRSANSLSLAAWFGGSLMGAVGLRRASSDVDGDGRRVEGAAWSAWKPIQTAAVVTQLASGAALTVANAPRVAGQRGVARTTAIRTVLTGASLTATVLAGRAGRRWEQEDHEDGSTADAARRRTRALQVAVPVLTGAMLVMDAVMGEQQRPSQVGRGVAQRFLPDAVADRLAA